MLRNVFLKTLRDLRGQILAWGVVLAVPTVGIVFFFPSIQGVPEFSDFLNILPEPIRLIVGDAASLSVLEGFLKMKLFDGPLPLLLSVFAIMQGAAMVAGEQENGTIDLLMSQPVKRWRVILEKFAALATSIVALCLFVSLALFIGTGISGTTANRTWLLLATFNLVPIVLVFGATAMLGSCVFRRTRHASMLAALVLVWSFFLNMLIKIVQALKPLRPISLFDYYSESLPLSQGVHWGNVAVLLGFLSLLVVASLVAFERKELTF